MNREEYRDAFDSIPFSPDFQERTIARLTREVRQAEEKENDVMKTRRFGKTAVLIAAAAALLVVSVSAAVLLLNPGEVAEELKDPLLAEALESEGAMLLDDAAESEGYLFRLAGLVSGKGLSVWCGDVEESRTYAVLSLERADGTALEQETFDALDFSFTPLVAGYPVSQVNGWTLGGGWSSFVRDGVAYYVFDTVDLQMFADHTVYLAVYQGGVPSSATFAMAEDGSISYAEGMTGPRALFPLPLDSAGADPEAVQRLMDDYAGAFSVS